MDLRDRLSEIFEGNSPDLRTLFDCDSNQWHNTSIDKKISQLRKMLDSGYPLEKWIEDYKEHYKELHPHVLGAIDKSVSILGKHMDLGGNGYYKYIADEEFDESMLGIIRRKLAKVFKSEDQPRKSREEIYYPAIKHTEIALGKLIRQFEGHTDLSEVYLKVTAINSLYSTNIYDTYRIAYHIYKNVKDIDNRLKEGCINLIKDIACGHGILVKGKEKQFYSFATKYCSFHNPKKYAIYDGLVQQELIKLHKIESKLLGKKVEKNRGLRDYKTFLEAIENFKQSHDLNELSLKEIDMYLWLKGKEEELKKETKNPQV